MAEAEHLLQLRALLTPQVVEKVEKPAKVEEGPDWTNRYCVVDASSPSTPLGSLRPPLRAEVAEALQRAKFDPLFPIQAAVIPLLAKCAESARDPDSAYCCDVCVAAPTGQGKTLAYAVPIVQALLDRLRPAVRALVLLPTRDLAMQVFRVFESLRRALPSGSTPLRLQLAVGAKALAQERRLLLEAPDILVCTPGRLAEHFLGRDACLDFSKLRWFVVDEADRLLTQTYHRWLEILDRATSGAGTARPQKLLFSATMTWDPRKLAALKLLRPLYFFSSRSGQHATPAQLRQHWVRCPAASKPLAVLHLLEHVLETVPDGEAPKVIVFCQSVNTAHRLSRLLQICCALRKVPFEEEAEEEPKTEDEMVQADPDSAAAAPTAPDVTVAEFSSTLRQAERNQLLKRFRRGQVTCLVCSDVVARGIDIPEVHAVVNYSAPSHIQTYIHRVGRTARAGKVGHTFTFVTSGDMARFEAMLRESADCWDRISKFPIPKEAIDCHERWWTPALRQLQRCLDLETKGKVSSTRPLRLEDLNQVAENLEETEKAKKKKKTESKEREKGIKKKQKEKEKKSGIKKQQKSKERENSQDKEKCKKRDKVKEKEKSQEVKRKKDGKGEKETSKKAKGETREVQKESEEVGGKKRRLEQTTEPESLLDFLRGCGSG